MSTDNRPSDRVRSGIELLDELFPGWEFKVAPEMLNIANSRRCVLGQVFGHYDTGVKALRAKATEAGKPMWVYYTALRDLGLCPISVADNKNLNRAWRRQLARKWDRREQDESNAAPVR